MFVTRYLSQGGRSREGRMAEGRVYKLVRAIGAKVGLQGLHPHAFRHACGVELLELAKGDLRIGLLLLRIGWRDTMRSAGDCQSRLPLLVTPVITMHTRSAELTVEAGRTGLLAKDLEEFQAHLAALAFDRARCESMGKGGPEYIAKFHSIDTQIPACGRSRTCFSAASDDDC